MLKNKWCPYCWQDETDTHMCYQKQLSISPDRLTIPRWVTAWENHIYWTAVNCLNFQISK